jgi:glycosyltransferase involved in cell wall biosynthesis
MRPLSGNLKRLIYWFILRRTEVIFLSTDLSNDFNDIKPLFSEIHVLNNFVSSFDKIEVMKRIEERAGRINNSKKFTILYLGHMTKSKGMYRALDVARLLSSRLKEVVFKFYGEFHNDFDHIYFEQYVKKFQLENVVNYNGFCSEEMKCEVFGSADIFILTSHSEAFPLVILEAMSYGLPIVATNTGAVSEILSGYGRLVENSLNSADFSSVFTNQIIASIQNHSKDVLISQVYHVEKNYQLEKFESNLFQILFSN